MAPRRECPRIPVPGPFPRETPRGLWTCHGHGGLSWLSVRGKGVRTGRTAKAAQRLHSTSQTLHPYLPHGRGMGPRPQSRGSPHTPRRHM